MTQWVNFKTVREHLSFHNVLAHYGIDEHGHGNGQRDQIKIICPFHGCQKPSCCVNSEKQVYNCFACDAGGNALDFVALWNGFVRESLVKGYFKETIYYEILQAMAWPT